MPNTCTCYCNRFCSQCPIVFICLSLSLAQTFYLWRLPNIMMNSEVSEWSIFSKNIENFRNPAPRGGPAPSTPAGDTPDRTPCHTVLATRLHAKLAKWFRTRSITPKIRRRGPKWLFPISYATTVHAKLDENLDAIMLSILIKESLCMCNANKLPLFAGVLSTPASLTVLPHHYRTRSTYTAHSVVTH